MKSIISYPTIRINEKNQPRRTAENVMNIIYIRNADSPVQLDTDDRRHLVCACKTVHQVSEEHKEDVEYFTQLSLSYTQEFYENLMTFFLERDISQFNPTLIPMTEAKKQLINDSRTLVDDIIIEHYELFKQGIPIALVNQYKPQNWKLTTFMNALQHKCTEQSPRINGKRTGIYGLNEDQQIYYDKMMNEEDIEASSANYQKYKKTIEDDGFIEQVAQGCQIRVKMNLFLFKPLGKLLKMEQKIEQIFVPHQCAYASGVGQQNDLPRWNKERNGTEILTSDVFVCHLLYAINEIIGVMCWRYDHYF
ncbi:MAG: hypothetical protein EZS28_009155 [Streblomastix strix]|uniref:Uncharacterized protein n=1 Tax=Streblomastix strix TaxID=222440 RepID=A0A5J4WL84_9EUKA|nr:MAG: hypothetical protein EZS28_009155 [Streblomastix strix]